MRPFCDINSNPVNLKEYIQNVQYKKNEIMKTWTLLSFEWNMWSKSELDIRIINVHILDSYRCSSYLDNKNQISDGSRMLKRSESNIKWSYFVDWFLTTWFIYNIVLLVVMNGNKIFCKSVFEPNGFWHQIQLRKQTLKLDTFCNNFSFSCNG